MLNPIRVMICDPCPTIRYGLQRILSSDSSIEIVAELFAPEELLTETDTIDADILIIELNKNDSSEIEFLKQFKASRPNIKIIVFTACSDTTLIIEALELDIQGFRLKQAYSDEIIKTIHTVYRGGSSLAPCVTSALLDNMQRNRLQTRSRLSEREQEVLAMIAKGRTNGDIAKSLYISTRTVKFHASSIFAKLNVKNRTEAAMRLRFCAD